MIKLFNEPSGAAYHGGAVAYAVFGYALGLAGLFAESWLINLPATLLLAHAMIIAAYMVHECGHNTVFRKMKHNGYLGRGLSWICGAAYGRFEDIRFKHFRHHVDNADVVCFDYEDWFRRHLAALRITALLEWFYIPAHELVMHGVMVLTSFVIPERRDQRLRNVTVIVIRGGVFATALWWWPRVAVLYALAYLLMLIVLRFVDSLQHDYDYELTLFRKEPAARRDDTAWEQAHTFSVPLSLRYPLFNWLTLNFGYHNAHHAQPDVPWYRLPALHRELFGDDPGLVIPLWSQLRIYHRGRVKRIVKWSDSVAQPKGADFLAAARSAQVYGGNAASFLTAV